MPTHIYPRSVNSNILSHTYSAACANAEIEEMKKEIANLRNDYEKLKGDRDLMEEWAIKYGTESGRMYPVDEKDLFTLPPDEFEKKYPREKEGRYVTVSSQAIRGT